MAHSSIAEPSYTLVEVAKGIHHYQLPSGQNVYVKSVMDQPIITLDTWVETGSVNETDATNGVSHFLEHLLFKGTNRTTVGEIDRKLEAMGGVFNAATSLDYTHYYIKTPANAFPKALQLHANMLVNASLPADAIERERAVVQEEINRSLDNPQSRLVRQLTATLFNQHGYAYDTLGPKSLIASVPRNTIVDYYRTWYQPNHFHTVVVGAIQPTKAVGLVAKAFSEEWSVPRKTKPDTEYQVPSWQVLEKPNAPIVKVMTDPNVTQAYVIAGYLGPKAADHQATFALDAGVLALGQGQSSRLYQQLKESSHVVQSIGAGNWTQHHAGLAYVSADIPTQKIETAIPELFGVVTTMATEGITKAELTKAKRHTQESFVFLNETTEGLAQSVGYNVTIGELSDFTDYAAGVNNVTQADVNNTLAEVFHPNHAVVVATVPEGTNTKKLEKTIRKTLKANAKLWPTSEHSQQVSAAMDKPPAVTAKTLPNGVRLLTKPRPSTETVALRLMIRGGKGTEIKPGTATVLARLLKQGTALRSQGELAQTLDEQGINLSTGAGQDSLSVTITALKANLGEALWLLRDMLLHPQLDEADLAQVKAELAHSIRASQERPSSLAIRNLQQALYPNHPYGHTGQRLLDSLPKLTREDILTYYHQHMVPNNWVVSLVGAFDTDEVARILTDAFPAGINGTNEAYQQHQQAISQGFETRSVIPPVAPLGESTVVRTTKTKQAATAISQGWLVPPIPKAGEWQTADGQFTAAAKQYASLKLINTILGTGLSSRLFVNLREKQGLGYVASSMSPSAQQASRFVLYMGTDPKNETAVLAGFANEIDTLKTVPLTAEELANGKQKLIGNFALAHETNADHAYYLAAYETMGGGYQVDTLFPKLVDSLTAEDIQQAAQAVFSQPSVTSIVAPEQ